MRSLWVAETIGLAVFAVAAVGGPGDLRGAGYGTLVVTLFILPALLCLVRAWLVAEQRLPWLLFGAGMLCWAAADAWLVGVLAGQENPRFPSVSDAFWLTYYAASLAAVVAMMRSGLTQLRKGFWIDAAVGGLTIASIAAALLVGPIIASTGASLSAVATNLTYPLMDVLIVGMLIGVFVVSNGRPGRVWTLIGAIWAVQAMVDAIYLYQAAAGDYAFGSLLDLSWPALMFFLAIAAWHRPTVMRSASAEGWGLLATTIAFAAIALALLTYGHWHRLDDTAVVLATLTVAAAFFRSAMTFGQMRTLAHDKNMAARNARILDAAGEGILGTDADGIVTFINPAGTRMTGYESGDLVGLSLHDSLHHTRGDGSPYAIEDCSMHASLQDATIDHSDQDVFWRKDGSWFGVQYTSTPIVEDRHTRGAVVVFHDITERRELERVKDEFTSVVSHELRTPLTSIRGSLGLLESGVLGPLPERAKRMTQIAVENTDRLVRLINDILDLERFDADGVRLRQSTCDAEQLIARATDGLLAAAVAADVTLAVDSAPATFEADADRIMQTLTNLIGNAVKFSPRGGTVQIASQRRSDDVLFTVCDSGRGVPADKLESIFGRFEQVDSSDSRQSGGTGLGLAICRSIVERHGGRIWALSAAGEGSTFSFTVPAPATHAVGYTPRPGGTRGSVLMCDDNPEMLEITGTLLEERGYHVMLADSGERALESALAERPDVILLDLLLPGMSGVQSVIALREHVEIASVPVVVLSVLPRCEEEMAGHAFVDWIEKPAEPAELFAALDRAIGPADEIFRAPIIEPDPASIV